MGSNNITPEIGTAPASMMERSQAGTHTGNCENQFRFWRCLACGINWRPDYRTELCDVCFARIFPPEG
jgi:hypothetical protein